MINMQAARVLKRVSIHSVISVAKISVVVMLLLATGCGEGETTGAGEPAAVQIEAITDGKALFELYCIACHGAGPGHPGTMRLQERLSEDQAPLLNRDNLDPEYVKLVVREGFKLMPPFRPTEITDKQLDLLAGYITGEEN